MFKKHKLRLALLAISLLAGKSFAQLHVDPHLANPLFHSGSLFIPTPLLLNGAPSLTPFVPFVLPDRPSFKTNTPNIDEHINSNAPDIFLQENPYVKVQTYNGYVHMLRSEYLEIISLNFEAMLNAEMGELGCFTNGIYHCPKDKAKIKKPEKKITVTSRADKPSQKRKTNSYTSATLKRRHEHYTNPQFSTRNHVPLMASQSRSENVKTHHSPRPRHSVGRPVDTQLHKKHSSSKAIKKTTQTRQQEHQWLGTIQSAAWESTQLEPQRARTLEKLYRKLPHGKDQSERRMLMKLESILKLAAHGPASASSAQQLLNYVEYVESKNDYGTARTILHTYLPKWRYKDGVMAGNRSGFVENTLFWATRINLRLIQKCCSEQMTRSLIAMSADIEKQDLDELLSQGSIPLNPELNLLSLLHYSSSHSRGILQPDDRLRLYESRLHRRWLGSDKLDLFHTLSLLSDSIDIYRLNSSDVHIFEQLERARQLASELSRDDSNKKMMYIYRCEHKLYEKQNYQNDQNPINTAMERPEQLFKQHRYSEAIDSAEYFIDQRNGLITNNMQLRLDNLLLKAHAAEFRRSRKEFHRKKAMKLLGKSDNSNESALATMTTVYSDLDLFEEAENAAIHLARVSSSTTLNTEHLRIAFEIIAQTSARHRLQDSLCSYALLLGDTVINVIFTDFEPLNSCNTFQQYLKNQGIDVKVTNIDALAATFFSMYHTLRSHGHFKEAIAVAEALHSTFSNVILSSHYFAKQNDGSDFLASLHGQIAIMSFALGHIERMKSNMDKADSMSPKIRTLLQRLSSYDPQALINLYGPSDSAQYLIPQFLFFKLIYLTRHYQLSRAENTTESHDHLLEIGLVFQDLWEVVLEQTRRQRPHNNSLYLANQLYLYYQRHHTLIENTGLPQLPSLAETSPFPSPPENYTPDFFQHRRRFIQLVELVLNQDKDQ